MSHEMSRRTLIGAAAALAGAAVVGPRIAVAAPNATAGSPGQFAANFVFAAGTVADNRRMIRRMNAAPITFGYRLTPVTADSLAAEVREVVGSRRAFRYSGGLELAQGRQADDAFVDSASGRFVVLSITDDAAVVAPADPGSDRNRMLIEAARSIGAQVVLGMPAPIMGKDPAWLPDRSYLPELDAFSKRFLKAYPDTDGYYHHVEMPMRHVDAWHDVRDLYARQNQFANELRPGVLTIIAPYLEDRIAKASAFGPEDAAPGYAKLLETANGTNLIIAPQDGLGTDTTALAVDDLSEHHHTTEEFFAAFAEVDPERIWVTVECMTPGGGTTTSRGVSTLERVRQQLDATAPTTRGAIGFMWRGGAGGEPGMIDIPRICQEAAGFGKLP
ncbi:hypothetical protein [Parenemella sanctibonifatiensis]|nr:hypothetical protein [Parenemella sanctibonifatiensis]